MPNANDKTSHIHIYKRMWRTLLWLAILLMSLFSLRLLFPYMAFHPTREVRRTPREAGLEYERATLLSGGYRLAAWYVPAPNARATLLFCHGNGGNLGHRVESIEIFHRLGLSVFIFDYRGYGESEGRPTPAGTVEDVRAAWDWLVREKGVAPEGLLLFGRSLGGAVALELTREVAPRAVILESTFASVFGAARLGGLPWLFPLLRFLTGLGEFWDSRAIAEGLTVPSLHIHSPDDGIVPYSEGRRLYEAKAGEKAFVTIHGDHNEGFLDSIATYEPALDDFATRHFGPYSGAYSGN